MYFLKVSTCTKGLISKLTYQSLNGALPSRKCSIKAPAKCKTSIFVLMKISAFNEVNDWALNYVHCFSIFQPTVSVQIVWQRKETKVKVYIEMRQTKKLHNTLVQYTYMYFSIHYIARKKLFFSRELDKNDPIIC